MKLHRPAAYSVVEL